MLLSENKGNSMRRFIILIFSTFIVSSCGTIQNNDFGLIEPSKIIIRSDSLVGSFVEVGKDYSRTVEKEDLAPYKTGILGVANREIEKLETLEIMVDEGMHRVIVRTNAKVRLNKEVYVGKGQYRELRIGQ